MTKPDITPEGIEKTLEGVTDGPWSYWVKNADTVVGGCDGDLPIADVMWCEADAEFIAYARNALPLIAEQMRADQARIAELEAKNEFYVSAGAIMQDALCKISQGDLNLTPYQIATDALDSVESIGQEKDGE
jgi:hypothetical protein